LTHFKAASLVGIIGVVVGLCAFLFNYHNISLSFPGYRLLVAPAIFVLSFISEETDFIPKMILFISGQFTGYFCVAYFCRAILELTKNKSNRL
jgi:hypothetical protein